MNLLSFKHSLRVFGWLLYVDSRSLWKDFFNNLLDAATWPFFLIFVNGIILPKMGLPDNYGAFTTVSSVVIMGAFNAWAGSTLIAADLAGPQTIAYELTLPLPYWMVWLKNSIYLSLKAAVFNILPLFLGKLILGNQLDLSNFSWFQFSIIYSISALFFGAFALFSTVLTSTHEGHSRLELRLTGPMFFLNGYTASWAIIYAVSPALGIFMRCLPWIYAYEGCRAAILGQAGYINIWVCVGMLSLFTLVLTIISLKLFKKRMDCV